MEDVAEDDDDDSEDLLDEGTDVSVAKLGFGGEGSDSWTCEEYKDFFALHCRRRFILFGWLVR